MKIYIKKIISSPLELKFIKIDLEESKDIIDKIILVESNYSHSGLLKEYIDDKTFEESFTIDQIKDIIRIKADLSPYVKKDTIKFKELHFNERVNRGIFLDYVKLNKSDIIFSLDADEVLYRNSYKELINKVKINNKAYQLKLHTLIYRPNLIWKDMVFIAPTVCKVNFYNSFLMKIKSRFKKYKQWRYHGEILNDFYGVHFNWHLTPSDILIKLSNYSHRDKFVNRNIDENKIKNMISNGEYIDNDINIQLENLDLNSENILPKSFHKFKKEFDYLLNQ